MEGGLLWFGVREGEGRGRGCRGPLSFPLFIIIHTLFLLSFLGKVDSVVIKKKYKKNEMEELLSIHCLAPTLFTSYWSFFYFILFIYLFFIH